MTLAAVGCGRIGFTASAASDQLGIGDAEAQPDGSDAQEDAGGSRIDGGGGTRDAGAGSDPSDAATLVDGGGADAGKVEADSGTSTTIVCAEDDCSCPTGASCTGVCDGGPCEWRCEAGSACAFECNYPAACTFTCAAGASCQFGCNGGRCTFYCVDALCFGEFQAWSVDCAAPVLPPMCG
jgi:hypothetical protein